MELKEKEIGGEYDLLVFALENRIALVVGLPGEKGGLSLRLGFSAATALFAAAAAGHEDCANEKTQPEKREIHQCGRLCLGPGEDVWHGQCDRLTVVHSHDHQQCQHGDYHQRLKNQFEIHTDFGRA